MSKLPLSIVAALLLTPGAQAQVAPSTPALFIQPIPNGPDLDLGGAYIGRLVGYANQSALLDVQVEVSGYEVSAVLTSRADKKTYRARGTRSIFPGSPVTVNLLGVSGQGSTCEGGVQEQYSVTVTFVAPSEATGAGGRGQVQRLVCDPLVRQFRPDPLNSGSLELARR